MSSNNGLITIGDQVYRVNLTPIDNRQFDRQKSEDGRNVKRIDVYSEIANVKISSADSATVSAHLHGDAFIIGDVDFTINVKNGLLSIALVPQDTYLGTNLSLDICIPNKIYEEICVKTLGEKKITVDNSISVKDLTLKSENGALFSNATFSNAFLTTSGGITELHINPTKDITVDFSTDSGHAFLDFSNIGHLSLSANSTNGTIHNKHEEKSGYQAVAKISTVTGNILIS